MPLQITYLVGSLSSESINRQLVGALSRLEQETEVGESPHLEFSEARIDDLPLYNRDLDDAYPPEALRLKESIRNSDGVLIATPEYNRSIPGVLKNAIDWASRPFGENAFAGVPVGIIGTSPGGPGTSMAQQHLRNILAYLDAPTLAQPEAFIQFTDERFADGKARDDETREFLADWLTAFRDWVQRFRSTA